MATPRWRDLRAEMTRENVTLAEVADQLGLSYAKFATLMAAEAESQPSPDFFEKVMAAIPAAAAAKGNAA